MFWWQGQFFACHQEQKNNPGYPVSSRDTCTHLKSVYCSSVMLIWWSVHKWENKIKIDNAHVKNSFTYLQNLQCLIFVCIFFDFVTYFFGGLFILRSHLKRWKLTNLLFAYLKEKCNYVFHTHSKSSLLWLYEVVLTF